MKDTRSDHVLLRMLAEGDRDAQDSFFLRYFEQTTESVARRLGMVREDAEEIAADAILWIMLHPDRCTVGNGRNMRPLLVRISRNLALDRIRSRSRVLSFEDMPSAPVEGTVEASSSDAIRKGIDAVLSTLAERDRVLAWWCAYGIAPTQVASWTDRSPAAARQRILRLKRKLRRALQLQFAATPGVLPPHIHKVISSLRNPSA